MFRAITSWFAPRETNPARRNQTMNSTRDAFSLPTHSPILPQTQSPRTPQTYASSSHGGDVLTASSYTYPPQKSDPYDTVPQTSYDNTRSDSRNSYILPLHNHSQGGQPSLQHTWTRIRNWLSEEYVEMGDTLNYGILPATLQDIELALGFTLPSSVRESYLITDGQETESLSGSADGLFFGLQLMPLEDVLEEWRYWREVDDDPATGANATLKESMRSIPPGWIRREYSQRGWLPLVTDRAGNYLGVDMAPDASGTIGQVIVFGRDFDTKVVMWKGETEAGWGRWLANFIDELESGEGYELGAGDDSEESEDSVGYESYFNDGTGGGGREGGADGSAPGLRLTGEYRGWPVLEAWADKSFKRWREAGLAPDPDPPVEGEPTPNPVGESDITAVHVSSARRDPLIVDVEPDAESSRSLEILPSPAPVTLERVTSVSTVRVPAPRPVPLPTQQDITSAPSASTSTASSPTDYSLDSYEPRAQQKNVLSAGRSIAADTVPLRSPTIDLLASDVDAPQAAEREALIILPSSPIQEPHQTEYHEPALSSDLSNITVTSGLKDVESVPPPPPAVPPSHSTPITDPTPEPPKEVSNVTTIDAEPSSSWPEADESEQFEDSGTTIRLVGGGGIVGTIAHEQPIPPPAEPESIIPLALNKRDSDDAASVKSAESTGKKKGLVPNFKRFSNLAGGKKKKEAS
ncbi:hypothetical protein SISNIDRAFT_15446 [Sistotremastrum niveocremeum HHB9708]|uniref:Knr4/Smi1-like domain-containing protein n=1 Tax=Sistotremastrum niveocremeum HHB9708 TaxID=1314777 RepID=A0A165AL76_9AGAM|nr:hypothetical protein SISNIDRAFT_15446 [Sistotremastrum niveocremeum HHB9708]